MEKARRLLAAWTEETGDTVPDNPKPHRHAPPRIEDGKIIPADKSKSERYKSAFPGASRDAHLINKPGPITFP